MFLLVRDVSRYAEWGPLFLGLFSTAERADAARVAYIESVRANDPLREQAYHVPDLANDVRVASIADRRSVVEAPTVFLVTLHAEGMGQSFRDYLAVFSSMDDASNCAETVSAKAAIKPVIPEYVSIEEIVPDDTAYFTASPFEAFTGGLWQGKQPGERSNRALSKEG